MLQRKTKATEQAVGERPSKAAKPSADLPVSERRLRSEVQALLVGVELSSVTLGKLREQVEGRLGLEAGALSARKRLRRQVTWVVQQEVVCKSQRSPICERIAKALVQYSSYPDSARQMLLAALPEAALYRDGAPHDHQVRLLETIREVISESSRSIEPGLAACKERRGSAEAEMQLHEAACNRALTALANSERAAELAGQMMQSAELDRKQAQEELEEAQKVLHGSADIQQHRADLVALVEGPLETVLKGSWGDDTAMRDSALVAVQGRLRELGAESALIDAVPIALARLPSERGMFDGFTAASVTKTFADKIAKLDGQLEPTSREAAEANSLGAAALLSASQERVEGLVADVEAARLAGSKAHSEHQSLLAQAAEQRLVSDSQDEECRLLTARLEELAETISMVDQLITGSWPQDADEEDGCCSPQGEKPDDAIQAVGLDDSPQSVEVGMETDGQALTRDNDLNVAIDDTTQPVREPGMVEHPAAVHVTVVSKDVGEAQVDAGNLEERVLMAALCGVDTPVVVEIPTQPPGLHSPRKLARVGSLESQLSPLRMPTPLRQRRSVGGSAGSPGGLASTAVH
jgi:hypothetical protein